MGETTPSFLHFSARTERELGTRGASQVWQEVIALARTPGVIDLGQGWPDCLSDDTAKRAAAAAILDADNARNNQYSAADGVPDLKQAIAEYYNALHPSWQVGSTDVLVTTSATEALYCITQAMLDAGDEVICFEPVFPWYAAHVRLAGATLKCVRMQPPHYRLDVDELASAFSPRTKMVIFNSPHNPTGHVATREEVLGIASLCVRHNVLALSDEVYERKTFGGRIETRLRDAPGMAERTLTLGTSSKLLSLTGWRVAWVIAPSALLRGVSSAHSYASFCAPTPLQIGVAAALREHAEAERRSRRTDANMADASAAVFERNTHALGSALTDVGLVVHPVEGGYFLVADICATGLDAGTYCKELIARARVAAVPMDVFYVAAEPPPPTTLVRFAICKSEHTIAAAAAAIRAHPLPLRVT